MCGCVHVCECVHMCMCGCVHAWLHAWVCAYMCMCTVCHDPTLFSSASLEIRFLEATEPQCLCCTGKRYWRLQVGGLEGGPVAG